MRRLGILLLWLLWRLCSWRMLGRLGNVLGALLYPLAGERRHIALTNLRLCFPQLDEAQLRALLKRHFRAFSRAALQETVSWWGSRAEVEAMTQLEGLEHLRPHLGKPLILLAPHFVGVTIAGVRMTTEFAPLVTLNARVKNPYIDELVFRSRHRFGDSEVYKRNEGIKPVLRALKRGLPFYYPPDMDFGRKDTLFVPFFGVPASTVSALPRLAKATGAVVVPAITRQQDDGYVTRFYPAWENFPGDDVEADTRRMNAFLEERIREIPDQYFWLHKRFKTRPEGEESVYG